MAATLEPYSAADPIDVKVKDACDTPGMKRNVRAMNGRIKSFLFMER
jgi:hypothetical protein